MADAQDVHRPQTQAAGWHVVRFEVGEPLSLRTASQLTVEGFNA